MSDQYNGIRRRERGCAIRRLASCLGWLIQAHKVCSCNYKSNQKKQNQIKKKKVKKKIAAENSKKRQRQKKKIHVSTTFSST